MRVIRLPRSAMNSADSEHQAQLVSTSKGKNKWVDVMVVYFVVLSDFSAAAQAETDVDGICDAA